ncbi:hypothetical protein [Entomobacter blattae]|uniref:Uncharacterized protein n=1 Tax=Entomobacter blattae TaxID=2762277 RepID=A0A7H1NRN7_9PROT|nr:hypothetical protein [Entomobacter blattae]QNT78447.1 hypothetical protein JGUZn3_12210 [Entomobacter blattae]
MKNDQIINSNGNDIIYGSDSPFKNSISNIAGNISVIGTKGILSISLGNNTTDTADIFAGEDTQTIFNNGNILHAYANNNLSNGKQIIIGGKNNFSATVFGGKTNQEIWTGSGTFDIISSKDPNYNNSTQTLNIQGGTSTYWGGSEKAIVNIFSGDSHIFLGNSSNTITIDLTNYSNSILDNFNASSTSLTITHFKNLSQLEFIKEDTSLTIHFLTNNTSIKINNTATGHFVSSDDQTASFVL